MNINQKIIGISAYPSADDQLLQQANIGWVRQGFGYPYMNGAQGEATEAFDKQRRQVDDWRQRGFQVLGHTPLLGQGFREPDEQGTLQFVWHGKHPDAMGELGSDAFNDNYRRLCARLAAELRGSVDVWQIGNEWDLPIFAGPLNPLRACELIFAAAEGLKEGNPDATVGTNHTGYRTHYFMLGHLYHQPRGELLDYCGVDAYYGTWEAGGPDDWASRIDELHALTARPVLVNEWGYSAAGGLMSEADRLAETWPCQVKAWRFAWGEGHTPQAQAEFIARAFDAFNSRRDKMLGCLFYRWEDQPKCWHCGQPDCPAETAWGIVDADGNPKPGYHSFATGAARLLAEASTRSGA